MLWWQHPMGVENWLHRLEHMHLDMSCIGYCKIGYLYCGCN
ncbi:hypothetical protein APHWI1_0406 [Anaplasma phagocytophilum str. ApWI1]|uniref:Uncharacterized protein n=1 Tax=Anaplasma phagocytophilum str. ApWI1 TaxID=1359155 RepID=A0A0F3PZD7_ANAPH|nr:hypothetical protein APHHGE2_1202 [Anaplasma phagocytophilum str. HGE2]KJV85236.1 hypothetical protein APHWI1_0406 [Anaplasma phagocytophilum str. ApWI1]KJV98453.1 hypothetical protein OTSANNIE_1176 [Anaplasma phagocytophilum str. Annie]